MSPARTIVVVLVSTGLVFAGSGLLQTVLPLRAGAEGFTTGEVGLLGTAYFAGLIAGCLLGPHLVARVGHIRAHAGSACLLAVLTLALPLWPEAAPWTALRLLGGTCLAIMFMTIESWLNDQASNAERGHILSLYVIVSNGGSIAGQLGLNLAALASVVLILLPTMAVCLSAAVLALTPAQEPSAVPVARLDLRTLYRRSPAATIGSFVVGASEGAFWSLGPLFGQRSGLSTFEVSLLMGAFVAGGTLSQWPLGRLSDRHDRRLVMLPTAIASVLTGIALALLGDSGIAAMVALAFTHGALMLPLYPLCIAHVNDQTPNEEMVQASGGLLLLYSLGAAAGPFAAAAWMDRAGVHALFYVIAILLALFALVILARLAAGRVLTREHASPFSLVARTTQAAYEGEPD